ncbi:MAG TPA: isocitrate/isopropylmalate family dehydrogenase, partial [Pirellulales bacterium]
MTTFKIALYPGDGIGVDVMDEAEKLLDALGKRRPDVVLERTRFPWGCEHYQKTGELFPPNILEILQPFDAVLLGAIGLPSVLPDHVTLEPLIKLRQGFDQYACVRPAKLLPGVACPLANKTPKDVDMLVIRENSEGEYVADGGRFKVGTPQEVAVQTSLHTRKGVERIIRFAFEQARKRRNRMTLVTKSNALKFSMVLWDDVWMEVRKDYPDVETDKQHVDAAAMNFVRRPEHFDVVVASNLFGDIL